MIKDSDSYVLKILQWNLLRFVIRAKNSSLHIDMFEKMRYIACSLIIIVIKISPKIIPTKGKGHILKAFQTLSVNRNYQYTMSCMIS